MVLAFHSPALPLAQFVEAFTFYAGYTADHAIERLLPDGAPHLVVNLDGQPRYTFDNDTLAPRQRCTDAWVSGMHSAFISISAHCVDASMFVIRFKPGGASAMLGLPMTEIDETVLDADTLLGAAVERLREALLEAPTPPAKFAAAEAWLAGRMRDPRTPEAVIWYAIAEIDRTPTLYGLARIASVSGYSQKHFIHLFKQHVGLTPKVYQRIARFNRALREIEVREAIHWGRLAQDCGYYDQAHFVHEFKQFSGLNPSVYLVERGEYLNYVPVR